MSVIALLTDFGEGDGFVGMVKGAILKVASQARIVDIGHKIDSFDIRSAAFLLERSVKHFPEGTVFLVVVDPGVGSERRMLAANAGPYYFVAPDNGVLSYVLAELGERLVISIENSSYWAGNVENTFHGRDIMGPVAAHIARGVALREFGPVVESYQVLNQPNLLKRAGSVIGEIVYVDKFGNMISNIKEEDLSSLGDMRNVSCKVGDVDDVKLCRFYGEGSGCQRPSQDSER